MIAEAIHAAEELAKRAMTPQQLPIADPRFVALNLAGEIHKLPIPPMPRRHGVDTLDDLIALANRFMTDNYAPVVWYDETSVVLVIDDEGHRVETATFTLDRSDVFNVLVGLARQKPWHEPKPLCRLLRVELAGTLNPSILYDKIRRVKFENSVAVTTQIGRKDESMGREISGKVDASGDIPEEVTLAAPVYKSIGETNRYPVRCAVDTDPMAGRIQLLPLPDEIERVLGMAVHSIAERLREQLVKDVPCYQGRP